MSRKSLVVRKPGFTAKIQIPPKLQFVKKANLASKMKIQCKSNVRKTDVTKHDEFRKTSNFYKNPNLGKNCKSLENTEIVPKLILTTSWYTRVSTQWRFQNHWRPPAPPISMLLHFCLTCHHRVKATLKLGGPGGDVANQE